MTPVNPPARILVGVDFDESSAQALKVAGALSSAFGSELTVVHAHTMERPAYFTSAQMDSLGAETAAAQQRCAEDVAAFVRQHTPAAFTPRVEEGSAAAVLTRLAGGFDLVVLGTHRRHGPRRWWLGSVAESVLRESPVPVLVVPIDATERTSS